MPPIELDDFDLGPEVTIDGIDREGKVRCIVLPALLAGLYLLSDASRDFRRLTVTIPPDVFGIDQSLTEWLRSP